MKNKKKIIALSGVILAIATIIGIGAWIGDLKNENNIVVSSEEQVENSSTNIVEELPLISEDGVNLTLTEENFEEIKIYMSNFEDAVIVKEINDITFNEKDEKNSQLIEMIEFHMLNSTNEYYTLDTFAIHSDPDLKEDYSNISEICNKHKIDTEKYFDENVINCKNLFDLFVFIVNSYELDISSFLNSRLDKDLYDRVYNEYNQKCYNLKIKENFNYSFMKLDKSNYDEIVSTEAFLFTNIDSAGNEYISSLLIRVNYKYNNELHYRNLTVTTRGIF